MNVPSRIAGAELDPSAFVSHGTKCRSSLLNLDANQGDDK